MDVIDQQRIDQLREIQDENSRSLLANLVDQFLSESPCHLETIACAIAQRDATLLATSAHYFQSGVELLGLNRLRAPCSRLERLGKDHDFTEAQITFVLLQQEFDLARQHLLQILANG